MSLTVSAVRQSAGVPDLNSFTFKINGYVSESVAYDAPDSAVKVAVKGLFGPKCPTQIDGGLGGNTLRYW